MADTLSTLSRYFSDLLTGKHPAAKSREIDPEEEQYNQSLSRLEGDIDAAKRLRQAKLAEMNADVKPVSGWRRALHGFLTGVGNADPNSDWADIIGAGAGRAGAMAASKEAYEQDYRNIRNRNIEARYKPQEEAAQETYGMDAQLTNLAQRRLSEGRQRRRDDAAIEARAANLALGESRLEEQARRNTMYGENLQKQWESKQKEISIRERDLARKEEEGKGRLRLQEMGIKLRNDVQVGELRRKMAADAAKLGRETYSVKLPMPDGKFVEFEVPYGVDPASYFTNTYGADSVPGKAAKKMKAPNRVPNNPANSAATFGEARKATKQGLEANRFRKP